LFGEGRILSTRTMLRSRQTVELSLDSNVSNLGQREASLFIVNEIRLSISTTLPVVLILLPEEVGVPKFHLVANEIDSSLIEGLKFILGVSHVMGKVHADFLRDLGLLLVYIVDVAPHELTIRIGC
jgi:hypothetical protein